MSKTKVFVIYHHPNPLIKSDVYTPICVGPNKNFFSRGFLRDDVGENIADKNGFYNELTAIYWVYKHLDEFEGVEYFGFSHYRRLFCFSELKHTAYVRKDILDEYIEIDDERMDCFFKDFDLLVPYPVTNRTVRGHYEKSHNAEDLDILLRLIRRDRPEFYSAAKNYIDGHKEFLYNMFVFKREDFINYAEFVFPLIEAFLKEKSVDRLFISERLTGIFISYLIANKKNPFYLPILHIRKKDYSASKSERKQIKKNYQGKDSFYKNKSLILYFMPRWLEEFLRRRITK